MSAAVVNNNKAFSNTVPGLLMKQNPELMKMFSSAMAQSMSQQNPAFSFASGIANRAAGEYHVWCTSPQLKPTQRRNPGRLHRR
jgi:putative hemolysin